MKMSNAHICQGHEGVGVGVHGVKNSGSEISYMFHCFLNGLVDTRPEDTTMGKQLCFGNALV